MDYKWLSPSLYKKFVSLFPICTVNVIFFDSSKKRTLLFKRRNKPLKNIFFSAGGRMIKNETFEDCAVRQSKKELGITINKKRLIFGGVNNEIHSESIYYNINYHCVNIYFGYILHNKQKLKLDTQHSTYRWFPVKSSNLHPLVKEKINKLLKKYD